MKVKPILLACMVSSAIGPMKRAPEKPNILFIAIDDMNDWITLFDKDNPIKTPNIERLAERGTFFTHAYCTVAASTPSRTSILSGYSPMTSGSYDNRDFLRKVVPDAVTLPDYFRKNGYSAKGAGKIFTHFNGAMGGDPAGLSFDDFQGLILDRGPEKNYNGYTGNEAPLNKTIYDWGEHTQKMTDIDMVEYIEKVMDDKWEKPMFLAAGIFKPHLPFYGPPETFKKYPIDKTALPPFPAGDLNDVPEVGKKMAPCLRKAFFSTIRKENHKRWCVLLIIPNLQKAVFKIQNEE